MNSLMIRIPIPRPHSSLSKRVNPTSCQKIQLKVSAAISVGVRKQYFEVDLHPHILRTAMCRIIGNKVRDVNKVEVTIF